MTMTLLRGTFNLRNSKGRAHRIAVGVLYVRDKGIPKRKDIRDNVGVRVGFVLGVVLVLLPLLPAGGCSVPALSVRTDTAVVIFFPPTVVEAVSSYL